MVQSKNTVDVKLWPPHLVVKGPLDLSKPQFSNLQNGDTNTFIAAIIAKNCQPPECAQVGDYRNAWASSAV